MSSILLIAALVMSLAARRRIGELTARIAHIERAIDRLRDDFSGLRAAGAPPPGKREERAAAQQQPSSPAPEPAPPPALAAVPPPQAPKAEAASGPTQPRTAAAPSVPAVAAGTRGVRPQEAPAEPPQRPERGSLEERLGTRWVVWAGGAALAAGGLFLVRYSIEAGPHRPRRARWAGRAARLRIDRCRRVDAPS
ncbi:MAG TPA: hypothetical protein PKD49_10515 [Hyphomicrobium sp.]|nr:hypothetical protein [Hyphomicrobium sp.]